MIYHNHQTRQKTYNVAQSLRNAQGSHMINVASKTKEKNHNPYSKHDPDNYRVFHYSQFENEKEMC